MKELLTWDNVTVALDVLIVSYLIYMVFKFSQHTKAIDLLKGVIVVVLIKIGSDVLHLYTLSWIIDQIITWSVIAIIIIFQPEIRRSLQQLGQNKLFKKRKVQATDTMEKTVEEISMAIQYLSKRYVGALLCIELNNSLNHLTNTGVTLHARISNQLLINIFVPNTPLHDGAVIIQNNNITAASCVLPLSENSNIPQELGTRHRAALGLSEQTDALVIVVSEETGDVSLAKEGQLYRQLKKEEFEKLLLKYLSNNHTMTQTDGSWLQYIKNALSVKED